jgi:uncharacterized membrane protein
MTNSPLTTFFLISGIVLLTISVIGQSKFFFAEINPGCFGRFLALIIGVFSLICAVFIGVLPLETVDLVKNYLAQQLQQNISSINQLLLGS